MDSAMVVGGWMDGWMFVQITIVDVKTMLKTNIVIRIMSVKVRSKDRGGLETIYGLCIIPVM